MRLLRGDLTTTTDAFGHPPLRINPNSHRYAYLEQQVGQGQPPPSGGQDPPRHRDDRRHERSRERSRSRDRRHRDDRRDRRRSRSRERSRDRYGDRRHSHKPRERTPPEVRELREQEKELQRLDRDTRTVFAYNLSLKADERDLFDFFSEAGTVVDIRIICDRHTKRSKGFAYIEYEDRVRAMPVEGSSLVVVITAVCCSTERHHQGNCPERQAVPRSNGHGQNERGAPGAATNHHHALPPRTATTTTCAQAEKNLAWEAAQQNNKPELEEGTTSRVNISNLLPELAESDITPIFAPFGAIVNVALVRNATGRSLGYGHVEYANRDDALRAVAELHGMELGGLVMRCKMSTVETANRAKGVKLAEVAAAAAQQAIAMGGNLSAALANVGVPMGATAGLSTDGVWCFVVEEVLLWLRRCCCG